MNREDRYIQEKDEFGSSKGSVKFVIYLCETVLVNDLHLGPS